MTEAAYPRDCVQEVLTKAKPPPIYRITPGQHLGTPLRTAPGDSRFCTKADGYTILYASPDFVTAFIATKPRMKLSLLDLREDGCVRLGAPTDTVNARNHAAGRALGRAIHAEHAGVDGLLFSSRLTGADVYAVFDRAIRKLVVTDSGILPDHPDLPAVLGRHKISLVVRR